MFSIEDVEVKTTSCVTDQIVENERCWLEDAWLTADAVGAATVALYDGHNTSGKRIFTLSCAVTGMAHLDPRKAILCENGLYVDLGSNVSAFVIQTKRA